METNKFKMLKDKELKLEREICLAMQSEDELSVKLNETREEITKLKQQLYEVINYKVFAKEGTDQVTLYACYDKTTEDVQTELNTRYGGSWVLNTKFKISIS